MGRQLSASECAVLKQCIKAWLISMNLEEELPNNITALNFGLFEPYGIELIGAKEYDADDADWACEEDFVPNERECPGIDFYEDVEWEEFLDSIVKILNELTIELKHLSLLQVERITTGFCDGDLVVIR